jgi:hypothetical protein
MHPEEKRPPSETEYITAEMETAEPPTNTADQQQEAENLTPKARLWNRILSIKISIVFMVPGIISLIFSITTGSQVLAFIGLGLTFWGALFLLIRPTVYVKGSLLDATAISTYITIDRIIKDLRYKGKTYYIPPYPKDVYLPEHLKGLKEMIAFISAETTTTLPSIEEIAKRKFILENPKGICIAPPGLGLANQIEKELRIDPTKTDLETLCEILPRIVLENFQLAKEIEMKTENNQVYLRITGSVYKDLYRQEELRSVYFLGCPIASAMACEIAKTTGRMITLQSVKVSPDAQIIEVNYRVTEG